MEHDVYTLEQLKKIYKLHKDQFQFLHSVRSLLIPVSNNEYLCLDVKIQYFSVNKSQI